MPGRKAMQRVYFYTFYIVQIGYVLQIKLRSEDIAEYRTFKTLNNCSCGNQGHCCDNSVIDLSKKQDNDYTDRKNAFPKHCHYLKKLIEKGGMKLINKNFYRPFKE